MAGRASGWRAEGATQTRRQEHEICDGAPAEDCSTLFRGRSHFREINALAVVRAEVPARRACRRWGLSSTSRCSLRPTGRQEIVRYHVPASPATIRMQMAFFALCTQRANPRRLAMLYTIAVVLL